MMGVSLVRILAGTRFEEKYAYPVEKHMRKLTNSFALSALNAWQQKDLSTFWNLFRPVVTEDLAVDGYCDSIVEMNLHLWILLDQFTQQLSDGRCTDQN